MVIDEALGDLIGLNLGPHDLDNWHVLIRTFIVYGFAILLLRIGNKRFLGNNTAFDAILGFILGSILSRAVTGNSAFIATLIAAATLVGIHWLLALVTYRFEWIGNSVKGVSRHLISNGEQQEELLRNSYISQNDLLQTLRSTHGTSDLESIEDAYLERSGEITVILKQPEPNVVDVSVEDGVQRVRIEWTSP